MENTNETSVSEEDEEEAMEGNLLKSLEGYWEVNYKL